MNLNLGCGTAFMDGFINVDCIVQQKGDKCTDVVSTMLTLPFKPNSFDTIYSVHSIEHFYITDVINILTACYELLKPGGKFIVEGPCILGIYEVYVKRQNNIKRYLDMVYGNEKSRLKWGDFYMHKSGWTKELMAETMQDVGYKILHTGHGLRHGMGIRDFRVVGTKEKQ